MPTLVPNRLGSLYTQVVWTIWWERNKCIFHKESINIDIVVTDIEKSTSEVVNVKISSIKCIFFFLVWDGQFSKNWKGIIIPFGLIPQWSIATNVDISRVNWSSSAHDFVKIKFDGVLRGNLGLLVVGIYIRDHLGNICALKSLPISHKTNNIVEDSALLHGLLLANKGGFPKVNIEGESMVIINVCIKRSSHN